MKNDSKILLMFLFEESLIIFQWKKIDSLEKRFLFCDQFLILLNIFENDKNILFSISCAFKNNLIDKIIIVKQEIYGSIFESNDENISSYFFEVINLALIKVRIMKFYWNSG